MYKLMNLKNGCSVRGRRGSVLVEFALIALILYLILAATVEFGRALMAAQLLQQAADIAAREIARTPGLPVVGTLTDWENPSDTNAAFNNPLVVQTIFDPQYLVVDIGNGLDYFNDKPILNRLLAPLMIPDYANGFLRYPGALVANSSMPSGYTVQIPVVTYSGGVEHIGAMLPVVEEILPNTSIGPNSSYSSDNSPFCLVAANVAPQLRGTVALRINYPFQAASLSATAPSSNWPPDPNFNYIHPSDGTTTPGTYSGPNGLGDQLVFATNVRPYRRLISAQAIYRREVLGP
ncbi:MAG: TadE/TadG family type IV pilus assembly protein [Isosphaeraceae bacterium]